MIAFSTIDRRFSKMSLAVAKDSGWYEVDMEKGDQYVWGKNKGCEIFDNTCKSDKLSMFCPIENHLSCSNDNLYVVVCSSSIYADNCKLNKKVIFCKDNRENPFKLYNYGYDSMCHNSVVSLSFFFNFRLIWKKHLICLIVLKLNVMMIILHIKFILR